MGFEDDDDVVPNALETEVDEDWLADEDEKAKELQNKADSDPSYLASKIAKQELEGMLDVRNKNEDYDVSIADDLTDEETDEDMEDYDPPVGAKHNEISPMESCERAEAAAKKYQESIAYRPPFANMRSVVSGLGFPKKT